MLHYITAAANRSVASVEISAVQHPDLFYSSDGWRVERHYKTQNGMLVTEPRGEIWGLSMVCFPRKTMKITRFSNDDILFFCLIFPIRFLPMCTNKLLFFHEVPAFKTLWASREFSGLAVPASFRQREAFGNCLMPWVGGGIPTLLRCADLEAELIPGAISSAQPFSTEKGVVVTWAADNSRELLPRWWCSETR